MITLELDKRFFSLLPAAINREGQQRELYALGEKICIFGKEEIEYYLARIFFFGRYHHGYGEFLSG